MNTIAPFGSKDRPARPLTGPTLLVGIVMLLALFLALGAWRKGDASGGEHPTSLVTVGGAYRVSYEPSIVPIPVNRLHTWTITIETPDGRPVREAEVAFDGDMPHHGHGLPTTPRVTAEIAPGDYLVEGVMFQMGGRWVIDVAVAAEGVADTVRFDLVLQR
jgi:hypothetical protein